MANKKLPIVLCLLFWALVISAFGDDVHYDYCVIKTKLKIVSDEQGDRLVPDVPCRLYSYYAVQEGTCVTYSKDLKLAGKEIMACVAVKHEDKDKIRGLVVGENFKDIKVGEVYSKHFPHTIGDMRRRRNARTGEIIEYEGADKDDPARFCEWCE